MAWRVDEAVEHGLIDNTVEGLTTGRIWLAGRDEPLILSLNGDCWRDLAGTVLEFENPNPRICPEASELDTEQTGIIGDVTASRKARVPEISEEEMDECERLGQEIPFQWSNVLYLEWFSEINGRVLIEAADYHLKVSASEWQMDEDQEEAQKLANLSAMRDFLAQVIRRAEPDDSSGNAPDTANPLFPALRSGHRLFQRPLHRKQIPSSLHANSKFLAAHGLLAAEAFIILVVIKQIYAMKFLLSALIITFTTLTSCSTSTPVMSAGSGQYVVSQSGTTGFTPLGPLRSGAYEKANRFAASKGGIAEIISVNETPSGFAVWPKVDVRFRVSHGGAFSDGLRPVERETIHSAYDATGRNTDSIRTIER